MIKKKAIISCSIGTIGMVFITRCVNKKNNADKMNEELKYEIKQKIFINLYFKKAYGNFIVKKTALYNQYLDKSAINTIDNQYKEYACGLLVRGKAFKIFASDIQILKKTKDIECIVHKKVNFDGESFVQQFFDNYSNHKFLQINWQVIRACLCDELRLIEYNQNNFMQKYACQIPFNQSAYTQITKMLSQSDVDLLNDIILFYSPY